MAMSSQFSLSLELTKLVPFGPLVNAAGHGLIRLIRDLQASGSDFITEEDLAQVFGRNRVEPLFASTFRTAVKHSMIHEVSSIAELVIEGGAGPTVRRSLNEPAYFAMVVQLSLLTFTHELTSLTKALTKAFERRTEGAKDFVAPPRYDALKGALRAIREQTCGFMWELILSAVEKRLYPSVAWTDGFLYTLRTIPLVIMQGLLDSLTAVQHLPENTRLRIGSTFGIPTIVVWAHQVLGLSVEVDINGETVVFGDGPVSVYVESDKNGPQEIVLLSETDDPFFHLAEADEDDRLLPLRQHPVRDYGTRALRLVDDRRDEERQMVNAVVTSCISIARAQNRDHGHELPESDNQGHEIQEPGIRVHDKPLGRLSSFPSVQRVLAVSRSVFASNEDVVDAIDLHSELPCPAQAAETEAPKHFGGSRLLLCLTHVVLVLGMVHGFDEDLMLHVESLETAQYMPFRIPDTCMAYSSLASLLQGQPTYRLEDVEVDRTSVISASGWSLCLASLACKDPSDTKGLLAFIRGVPARGGERRRYIIDGALPLPKQLKRATAASRSRNKIVAGPGDTCALESWSQQKKARHLIGITDHAFEIATICETRSKDTSEANSLTLGFRSMQEISWNVVHVPACMHNAELGQSLVLPDAVWTFHGFQGPALFTQNFPQQALFAGLVAGDSSARWMLCAHMLQTWKFPYEFTVYVRGRDCCFECSVKYAKRIPYSCAGLVL
ncbi:MAG: hypothetical protein Q9224_003279 [Gallowayella concinna]